jgi:acetyltransferase-like isoleucine patch superfamily enzyme
VVAPGAVVSGGVHLGRSSYIGARAAVRQNVRVGERALVGMGAVVLRDVDDGDTVVGNPARPLASARRHEREGF